MKNERAADPDKSTPADPKAGDHSSHMPGCGQNARQADGDPMEEATDRSDSDGVNDGAGEPKGAEG